jgi:hypothetical protein
MGDERYEVQFSGIERKRSTTSTVLKLNKHDFLLMSQLENYQWGPNCTSEKMHKRRNAQARECTSEGMHKRENAQAKKCTSEKMHKRKNAQVRKCTSEAKKYTSRYLRKRTYA